ncbi:hypothetical protein KXV85_006139, partial [Aspergillus fumigatus]
NPRPAAGAQERLYRRRQGAVRHQVIVGRFEGGFGRIHHRRYLVRRSRPDHLHVRHHGQSQGRRHASPRRLSQRRQQHSGRRPRPAPGLSVDSADVSLQRLVLPVDHGSRGRHQCLPAQGRSHQNLRADPATWRHPHVRGPDRLQHPDQCARCTQGRESKAG